MSFGSQLEVGQPGWWESQLHVIELEEAWENVLGHEAQHNCGLNIIKYPALLNTAANIPVYSR